MALAGATGAGVGVGRAVGVGVAVVIEDIWANGRVSLGYIVTEI